MPFAVSSFSSFADGNVRAGWQAGMFAGYAFSRAVSLEAQASWGRAGTGARPCCTETGYWLGADGRQYYAPADGMDGWVSWLAAQIEALALVITAKAEEGRIFGSVTSSDLAEAMAKQGVEVERKQISVDPIKQVGQYEATIKLHKNVKATIHFTVAAQEE